MGKSTSRAPAPPDPTQVAAQDAAMNRVSTYTPVGSSTYRQDGSDAYGNPMWRQDIQMSPEQQRLYDLQTQGQTNLAQAGTGLSQNIASQYGRPVDTSGLPARPTTALGGMPELQTRVGTNGLPELGGSGDYNQNSIDSLYRLNTQYLDPQFNRREDSIRTRLANQGAVEGSEAWNNAMQDFEQSRETAYRSARDSAIAGGAADATRLASIDASNRGQLYGERLTGADFTNRARDQQFGQNLAAGSFADQMRNSGLNERFALRQQPVAEYQALMGMTSPQMPQVGGATPVDVAGNVYRSYQGDVNNYNAQQAGRNNLLSSLFGLGGTLGSAMILSDENAKEGITPIGEIGDLGIYSYTYKGDDSPQIGLLAQEAELMAPDSVKTGPDGYKRVNYQKALGAALMRSVA